ncbi:phage major capsid protein [Acetobacter sp. A11-2]|uniref:phage major capsid protein n=1 Tax=Acetobacter sp. A11-2 TaxID=3157859 RepID=UPI0032EE7333
MKSKELRAKRAKLIEDARALTTGDTMTAEQAAQFDAMMAEADQIKAQIDRIERAEDAERTLAQGVANRADDNGTSPDEQEDEERRHKRVFASWLLGGINSLTGEDRDYVVKRMSAAQSQFKNDANGTGTGPAGGYLVPPAFSDQLLVALKDYFSALDLFDEVATATGADLPWPTNDDTSRRARIIGENNQIGQSPMTFSQSVLKAFLYATDAVLVPWTLMEDSFIDLDAFITTALGTAFGRTLADDLTNGTGNGMPMGVATAAAAGPTSVGDTIAFEDIMELKHSVNRAYRTGAVFMMNDNTVKSLALLKDNEGRPLWIPSLQVDCPDVLAGFPIAVNESMADVGAGNAPILFGNMKNYKFRIVKQVSIVRLNERYADFLQTGFFGYARFGGGLPSAAQPIKKLVMKAAAAPKAGG